MLTRQQYQRARQSKDARFDGAFFIAVKTTGIFCRPICPAKSPNEQNIEYFMFAQSAMQSGYRPCLRCRPDSAPQSFAWKGVDSTIEKGIRLLKAHPDLAVAKIASRLGITDRYFRQLFQKRLGISPKQFQLFEQLLFAKQLLHQSTLTVDGVAQACRFASTRRLQDNLKKHTGLTPSQIRRSKKKIGQQLNLQLSFRPPYDWAYVREFLKRRELPGMEEVDDVSYARTFRLGPASGWFRARYHPDKSHFSIELDIDQLSELKPVLSEIRRVLDLDAETQAITEQLEKSGIHKRKLVKGIRLVGIWSPFEAGCRAILAQQISLVSAVKLTTQLVHELGEPQNDNQFYFPDPKAVAKSDLEFLKIPKGRRETLARFAEFSAKQSGGNDANNLSKWLNLKGIGPWTVDYARMRGCSEPDVWLDSDLVIKKQINANQVEPDLARPWRSYLTLQLWSMA